MEPWIKIQDLNLFVNVLGFLTKFSSPRFFNLLNTACKTFVVSSILKVSYHIQVFERKNTSGIFIAGKCPLSDKSLDFLLDKLEQIKTSNETNSISPVNQKTSYNLNIITGINCCNVCKHDGHDVITENHGAFYCDEYYANTNENQLYIV